MNYDSMKNKKMVGVWEVGKQEWRECGEQETGVQKKMEYFGIIECARNNARGQIFILRHFTSVFVLRSRSQEQESSWQGY